MHQKKKREIYGNKVEHNREACWIKKPVPTKIQALNGAQCVKKTL